jgi:trimeric autotransporter adhesin
MKPLIKLKTTTLLVIPLVLACFALLPRAQAQTPEGTISPAETISPLAGAELPGFNTELGFNALNNLTTGTFNSAFGALTLVNTSTGSHNTAVGGQALRNNNGSFNTAVGENALVFNTTGVQNMALGQGALANNLTGNNNVAMGFQALNANKASGNIGVGFQALRSSVLPGVNTFGGNVAIGNQAMFNTVGSGATGDSNTAIGDRALLDNVSGFNNTAVGIRALENSLGNGNIAIGAFAGSGFSGASSAIAIGTAGSNESSRIFVGRIANQLQLANNGTIRPVTVRLADGRLGFSNTNPVDLGFESSRRFKDEIKPLDKGSEVIYALKPVTFRYKADHDETRALRWGLIAEDVEKVNRELVSRDEEGKTNGVYYNSINTMVLNEFIKEHKKVQELEATVAKQAKGMELLAAQLKEQAAQIQKVSAQLEVSKPATRTIANK